MTERHVESEVSTSLCAGLLKRTGAATIDIIVLGIVCICLFFLLPKEAFEVAQPDGSIKTYFSPSLLSYLSFGICCWIYKASFESSRMRATLGKRALKLEAVDYFHNQLTFSSATLRSWPWWLPWFGMLRPNLGPIPGGLADYFELLTVISLICIGLTAKKQGLHDLIAGCFVLKRNADISSIERDEGLSQSRADTQGRSIVLLVCLVFVLSRLVDIFAGRGWGVEGSPLVIGVSIALSIAIYRKVRWVAILVAIMCAANAVSAGITAVGSFPEYATTSLVYGGFSAALAWSGAILLSSRNVKAYMQW